MNAQHTPGPWRYEMTIRHGEPFWDIYPPADLPTGSRFPIARGAKGHNARLIAAAPDLLAALRMVSEIWSHDQTANLHPESPLAIVRAALAKVEGI